MHPLKISGQSNNPIGTSYLRVDTFVNTPGPDIIIRNQGIVNGYHFVTTNNGGLFWSTDGVNFSYKKLSTTNYEITFSSICFSSGTWYFHEQAVFGSTTVQWRTTDFITFTSRTVYGMSVYAVNNKLVGTRSMPDGSANWVAVSNDFGVTWSAETPVGSSSDMPIRYTIVYGNGVYVTSNGYTVTYSTNLTTWTSTVLGTNSAPEDHVLIFTGSRFVICSKDYSLYSSQQRLIASIFHSTNGSSWTKIVVDNNPDYSALPFFGYNPADSKYYIVCARETTTRVYSSTDALSWTQINSYATSVLTGSGYSFNYGLRSLYIAFMSGKAFIPIRVGNTDKYLAYSSSLATNSVSNPWQVKNLGTGAGQNFAMTLQGTGNVAYFGKTKFSAPSVISSWQEDGTTNASTSSFDYVNGLYYTFIQGVEGETQIATSSNGLTFTQVSNLAEYISVPFISVIYVSGNSVKVFDGAADDAKVISTSDNWATSSSNYIPSLFSAAFPGYYFYNRIYLAEPRQGVAGNYVFYTFSYNTSFDSVYTFLKTSNFSTVTASGQFPTGTSVFGAIVFNNLLCAYAKDTIGPQQIRISTNTGSTWSVANADLSRVSSSNPAVDFVIAGGLVKELLCLIYDDTALVTHVYTTTDATNWRWLRTIPMPSSGSAYRPQPGRVDGQTDRVIFSDYYGSIVILER